LVHLNHTLMALLLGLVDQGSGCLELAVMLGKELRRGDEYRAGQAGVRVLTALLQRQRAVPVGQCHLRAGQVVLPWADLLRDAKRRGMRAPVLAMGDGALGFWSALREVFPTTREQRCWFHKIANVLAALPKSAHPGAKKALAEIWSAEDKDHARKAAKAFQDAYGAKFPKATEKITDDLEELLAFYDFPAEHWIHLRTTNPIESTFATVRHRTKVTKGPGSKGS